MGRISGRAWFQGASRGFVKERSTEEHESSTALGSAPSGGYQLAQELKAIEGGRLLLLAGSLVPSGLSKVFEDLESLGQSIFGDPHDRPQELLGDAPFVLQVLPLEEGGDAGGTQQALHDLGFVTVVNVGKRDELGHEPTFLLGATPIGQHWSGDF